MNNPSVHRISTIKAAITHCATSCNHPVLSPGFVPTRLLFIGSEADTTIRVVIARDTKHFENASNARSRYSALSYCWGPPIDASRQCTTTKSTLASRIKGIPWEDLSPIVQDAIIVTKQLDLSYLWIDALCILQDDVSDWEAESSVMGKIYSNAWVTIVGLNSASCARGFLDGRWSDPAQLSRITSESEEPDDDKGNISDSNEEQQDLNEVIDPSTAWKFASALSKARWSSRGWTFQERALSTRLLYFDSLNVHLRCANFTFREGKHGPLLGRQLAFLEPGDQANKEILHGHSQPDKKDLHREELLEAWRNIFVPSFGRREFSRPPDNLPAISGLARYIGEVSGYRYAAGLWVEEFWREVVWYGRSTRRKGLPTTQGGFADLIVWLADKTEYIGPSWSWAREGGGMTRLDFLDLPMRPGEQRERVDVVALFEFNVKLKGLNPYGQVTGGELLVTSKILPLLADDVENDHRGFELDWNVKGNGGLPQGLEMVVIGTYRATERVHGGPGSVGVERWRVYGLVVYPSPVIVKKYYRVGIFSRLVSGEEWRDMEAAAARTVVII
ncbi:Heterokaryon incompatibility protein (HET) domain containing protein [Naviculisporaceae sp. PSN 640]